VQVYWHRSLPEAAYRSWDDLARPRGPQNIFLRAARAHGASETKYFRRKPHLDGWPPDRTCPIGEYNARAIPADMVFLCKIIVLINPSNRTLELKSRTKEPGLETPWSMAMSS
jgi:hypothetical protein